MPAITGIGGRIKGTLGDIDPLNKALLKRARSRVQKGYPLRGLPNTTPYGIKSSELRVSDNRGPSFATLNRRLLIFPDPKIQYPLFLETPNSEFRVQRTASEV